MHVTELVCGNATICSLLPEYTQKEWKKTPWMYPKTKIIQALQYHQEFRAAVFEDVFNGSVPLPRFSENIYSELSSGLHRTELPTVYVARGAEESSKQFFRALSLWAKKTFKELDPPPIIGGIETL